MIQALLVSNTLLWLLVLALAGVVAALARQVGVLHERLAPLGALATAVGPVPGEAAPVLHAPALSGARLQIGGADAGGRSTLLFFASPTCPICKTLLPTVRRAVADEDRVRVVYASDGELADHAAFARAHELDPASYVVSRELGMRYEVAKLPYAVLIDANGIVRAKGIVNTREHLESLFEAERLGVPTIQDHLALAAAEPARPQRILS
ncbi:MAG TPA: methylamine dehydrogenase accessory protein MauD [Myxococcota bacterium]|nr:methylamine dehydrogenase accessory protein MauD [Myxococcota bacterium]